MKALYLYADADPCYGAFHQAASLIPLDILKVEVTTEFIRGLEQEVSSLGFHEIAGKHSYNKVEYYEVRIVDLDNEEDLSSLVLNPDDQYLLMEIIADAISNKYSDNVLMYKIVEDKQAGAFKYAKERIETKRKEKIDKEMEILSILKNVNLDSSRIDFILETLEELQQL